MAELLALGMDPVREGCTSARHPLNGLFVIFLSQYPNGRDRVMFSKPLNPSHPDRVFDVSPLRSRPADVVDRAQVAPAAGPFSGDKVNENWRSRTSRRVMTDTRSGAVGCVVQVTNAGLVLSSLTNEEEWTVPATLARAATLDEVAAAVSEP